MKGLYLVVASLACVLLLAGCSVKEVPVQQPQVIEVLDGKETKPVSFGRVVMKVPVGKPIIRIKGGLACVQAEQDTPMPSSFKVGEGGGFARIFYEEFKRANYNILGDPGALFEEDPGGMSELAVSCAITDMWVEMCFPLMRWGNYKEGSGTASVDVEWQVYNRLDKKVIFKRSIHGAANYSFKNDTEAPITLVLKAAANSVQGLLADKGFYKVVALDSHNDEAAEPVTNSRQATLGVVAHFDSSPNSSGIPIAEVPKSVVTIQEGASHGSGFLLTADGYIITNQHVVGNLKRARVIFQDGRKVDGVVVARDAKRDAALIKIDPPGVQPLKVNPVDLAVGSDVYAIGSPKDPKLAGTLTKGVVSGYRHFNGVRWIQADAAINHGNSGGPLVDAKGRVVGITTLSRVDAQGIFFFGPIADVLKTLGIEHK